MRGAGKPRRGVQLRGVFFSAFLFLGWGVFASRTTVAKERPNLILITIDTLRADHLRCYGYRQIRTPNVDQLAVDGVRFAKAYSPVPITLPAHAAVFTGSYPMRNGMRDFSGNRLPSGQPTLASLVQSHGYATAGIVGSAVLDSRFGLDRGFDFYDGHFDFSRLDETNLDAMERPGNVVADKALAWLSQNYRKPFFLWIHLYDPHYPYRPPAPYSELYKTQPYDGEIAFADTQVGRVLAFLKQKNLYDNTFIIVAGDHGEGLGEHGEKTHGFFIYNPTLHVPLILKLPAGEAVRNKVVSHTVSLIDLLPTVLQVVGLPVPGAVQGKSLLPLMLGQPSASSEGLYAETYLPRIHFNWSELRSVLVGSYHFIDAPKPELYDLSKDPRELQNLFSRQSDVANRLRSQLVQLVKKYSPASGRGDSQSASLDPMLMERLKSLGYAAVSAGSSSTISNRSLPDPKERIQMYELVSEAISDSQHGRHRESLQKLRAAEKIEPASLPVRYLEALDYYRLKDLPSAIERFKSALELDPKFALAAYYLGLAQAETGDLDAGMSSFERALALDPTNFSAAYNLGALYLRKNRLEDAVRQFQRAIEVNPNYAQAYEALGQLYLYQGRTKEAVHALERAVELAPNFPKAHYNLGRAYQVDGRAADAQREFSRADALGSRDKLN